MPNQKDARRRSTFRGGRSPDPLAANSASARPAAPMAAAAKSVTAKADASAPWPVTLTPGKWAASPPAASQNWRR
ncbi:hypothetical protein DDE05_59340 [Streptomyces cavourensis]|nr:hypothetical protein DDE05_59340 [Streptomyces cavourensis]